MGSAALAISRAASFVSLLILVRVLLEHLTRDQFGLWMTFSAIVAVLTFADLGLGYGLMSATARVSVREGTAGVQRLLSSAIAATTALTLPLCVAVAIGVFVLPMSEWLGATAIPESQVRNSTLIVALGLLLTSIPAVAARVQSGLQASHIASLWSAAATLAGLAAVVLGTNAGVSFTWLVALFVGTPLLVTVANAFWYFRVHSPGLLPTWAAVRPAEVRGLFRIGFLFFVLQLCAALTFATDNLILAAELGVDAVPTYAVPARLFSCIGLGVAIAVQPLWPAYAEALERNDLEWIRRTFVRSLLLASIVSVLVGGAFYYLRDLIFPLWTRGAFEVDDSLIAALALWSVVDAWSVVLGILLNGLHIVRFQVVISLAMTVCSFPVRYWFLRHLGPWGLPLATSIVCLVTAIIPCFIVLPKILKERSAHTSTI